MPKNIFRNGTESRESLPLRSEANRKTTSKRPTGWHTRNLPDCNGTKSRESLPLRNEENRNQPPKGLQEETQGICPTATAPNHGNHCRCGARRFKKQPHKGPQDGTLGICLTATAPNHGNRCRCGTKKIEPAAKRPAGRDARNLPDRNGTESRESLPLRSEANRKTTSKRPAGWEHKESTYRYGTGTSHRQGYASRAGTAGTPCKGVPERQENGSPLQLGIAGNADTGPVAMVRAARRRKGVPQRRENGSPLQLGNAGNAATGPVAMVETARRRKGVP